MEEIIRNKLLTKIINHDHELRLSTKKYDDIVGICNNEIPEFKEYNNEFGDAILFNGKIMSEHDLLEFADMQKKLYQSSILHASYEFNTDKFLNALSNITIKRILLQMINSDFTISYPSTVRIKQISRELYIDDYLSDSLTVKYNEVMSKVKLYDISGNIYTFNYLHLEEISRLIEDSKLSDYSGGSLMECSQIILKTNIWKRCTNAGGYLKMIKNGVLEDLVEIPSLRTEKEIRVLKQYGKSAMSVRNLALFL